MVSFHACNPLEPGVLLQKNMMAAKKVNFAACGQVGFPRSLPPVAGRAVSL
jgi:hypothetical protein